MATLPDPSGHALVDPVPPRGKRTPITHTTRRGMATASFCFGVWSCLVFWWYPYSVFIATCGLALGLLSLVMGVRAGKDGENLALAGTIFCSITLGTAFAAYRGVQWLFEGSIPFPP